LHSVLTTIAVGSCSPRAGPVVFGEGGSGPFATVAGSLVAFDAEARLLYVYLLHKDGAFSLVEVESETGRLTAFEPTLVVTRQRMIFSGE